MRETAASVPPASGGAVDELPVLGPTVTSHWHAAYIVRICGEVLEPFDSVDDPLGIHSHADGLIHIHPFFEESAYDAANLGAFADAMGVTIDDGELTIPGSGTWRDGDLCDGLPGRVFVDKWVSPDPAGATVRHFDDLAEIRFEGDRELYQIGFAAADSPPVVPPSIELLDQVSAPIIETEPWVVVDPSATPAEVRVWPVASVTAPPCTGDAVEERVLTGTPGCYVPGPAEFTVEQAFTGARAVSYNRQAAVQVTLAPMLQEFLAAEFERGLTAPNELGETTLAIEIAGGVVTAPRLVRVVPDRSTLVLTGGFTAESALALAALLN